MQVQNGILYIRYRSSSKRTTAEWCRMLTDRNPSLIYSKMYSQSPANLSHCQQIRRENLEFVLFSLCITQKLLNLYKHYICNHYCYTIRALPFLFQSCMQSMVSKLDLQICIMLSLFLRWHFVHISISGGGTQYLSTW